jgi:hypothetical protein
MIVREALVFLRFAIQITKIREAINQVDIPFIFTRTFML